MAKEAAEVEDSKRAGPMAGRAPPSPAAAAKGPPAPGMSPTMPAGRLSILLKAMAAPAKGPPSAPGSKAQVLKEIQRTFGNAYAQKVIAAYGNITDKPAANEGAGAKGGGAAGKPGAAKPGGGKAPAGATMAKPAAAAPAAGKEAKGAAAPGKADAAKGGAAAKAAVAGKGDAAAGAGGKTGAAGEKGGAPKGKAQAAGDKPGAESKGAGGKGAEGKGAEAKGAEGKGAEGKGGDAGAKGGEAKPGAAGKGKGAGAGGGKKGGASAKGGGGKGAKGGKAEKGGKGGKEGAAKAPARVDAGGGPHPRAGGGGGGGRGGGRRAHSPQSPDEDPEFQKVKGKTKKGADKVATHEPAETKASEAQGAAVGPANEVPSKAAANHAGAMDQTQPKPFSREAFKAALLAKITALTPKNLEEADDFKESGKVGEVKGAVSSEVGASKDESQGDIEKKTKETPSASGIAPKPVDPLAPEGPGPGAGNVGAPGAAPKSKTASETSLKQNSKKVDDAWKETGLDDKDVDKSNEPSFKKGRDERNKAKKDCEERPEAYREKEADILQQSQAQAEGTAENKLAAMQSTKAAAMEQVAQEQGQGKTKDEKERERVAGEIKTIFDRTKSAVERKLEQLDTDVNKEFDTGSEAARVEFENYVAERMRVYKNDRYGGFGGGALWLKDKLFGMPDEVNEFYTEGRELYLAKMEAVIDKVSILVETGLNAAKDEIAKGKAEVDAYVAGLDPSLQDIGREEADKFASEFDALEQSVQDKQGQLVDALAAKYVANLQKLDERIEEMKAANKGLVDAVVGAIKAIIQTIIKLKNMLLNVLARAAAAIGKIIKDPIGFLGNLVAAVKGGIMGFKERIGTHLQNGLMGWLMGAMGDAGITLPASFDLMGILSLVMQVLGLTYANIRARAVAIVGEPIVKALETAAEIFKILITQGPAGLWNHIKDQVGDIKSMIIEGITSFVIEKLVIAGVTWLISMLNPASAFIKACKMIYDVVMFFVQRASQIMAFVNSVIDSVTAIAAGNISGASAAIEGALAKSIPVVLSFLAALLGLNGISAKIRSIIEKIRAPINKAIDWVINKAVALVKAAGKLFAGKGKKPGEKDKKDDKKVDPQHDAKVQAGLAAIDKEEEPLKKNGKIEKKDAQKVAQSVRRAHPIFKSITVVDGGKRWDYAYKASDGTKPGEEKAEDVKLPVKEGDTVIVEMGGSWNIASVSKIDLGEQLVWCNVEGSGRRGMAFKVVIANFTSADPKIIAPFNKTAKGKSSNPYAHLPDVAGVGPKKHYSGTQKAAIIAANIAKHGTLTSDKGGAPLVPSVQRTKGSKVDPNAAEVDHDYPRSAGGWNTYANAILLGNRANIAKSAKITP